MLSRPLRLGEENATFRVFLGRICRALVVLTLLGTSVVLKVSNSVVGPSSCTLSLSEAEGDDDGVEKRKGTLI